MQTSLSAAGENENKIMNILLANTELRDAEKLGKFLATRLMCGVLGVSEGGWWVVGEVLQQTHVKCPTPGRRSPPPLAFLLGRKQVFTSWRAFGKSCTDKWQNCLSQQKAKDGEKQRRSRGRGSSALMVPSNRKCRHACLPPFQRLCIAALALFQPPPLQRPDCL